MNDPTLQEANAYFSQRLYNDDWTSADSVNRQKALTWAICIIKALFLPGPDVDDTQEFVASTYIAAVCEQAVQLLRYDPTSLPEPLLKGIVSASVSGTSVAFARDHATSLLCNASRQLLGTIGTCRSIVQSGTIEASALDH